MRRIFSFQFSILNEFKNVINQWMRRIFSFQTVRMNPFGWTSTFHKIFIYKIIYLNFISNSKPQILNLGRAKRGAHVL